MAIGFYTRGTVNLPHPEYPIATLCIIEDAIHEAWRVLREQPGGDFDIKSADEDRVTRDLVACLTNTILDGGQVAGFTSAIFCISRESKCESYDGRHLDKMPDICIRVGRRGPVGMPSADGLFVECKPVDQRHPVGGSYCDKGVIRFVNGDYAWASSQAMMVGYAAPKYTLPEKLSPPLKQRAQPLGFRGEVTPCRNCKSYPYGQTAHITVHHRGFVLPQTQTKATPIAIRHIWVNRE
jgi:hypothetical protein